MEEIVNYKIYALYTDEDGIRYIGYTKRTLEKRFGQHIYEAERVNNDGKYVFDRYKDKWLRKNLNNVKIILIEGDIYDFNLAMEREIYWIKYYRENLQTKFLNCTDGGGGSTGRKMSEKTKQILLEYHTGRPISEKAKQKISKFNKGKTISEEHKQKISEANTGRPMSDSTKQKLIEANTGRIFSEEHKRKISESGKSKGRKMSEEHKQKLIEANTGRPMSEEHKQRLLEINLGRPMSDENKQKVSERFKDKHLSEEQKQKISKSNTGKKFSDEHKQKISEAKRVENLSPETRERLSKAQSGTKSNKSKLTEEEVIEIRTLYANKEMNQKQLSEKYNIDDTSISSIILGVTWKYTGGPIQVVTKLKLTEQDVLEIRRLYDNKEMSVKDIAQKFNASLGCITKIIYRQSWKHI